MSKRKAPRASAAKGSAQSPIVLAGRLTIVDAAQLRGTLQAALAGGGPLVLDGTRAEDTDTAVLQLLASLWRSCLALEIGCRWEGVSEALRESANLIGLTEALHIPGAIPGQDRPNAAA